MLIYVNKDTYRQFVNNIHIIHYTQCYYIHTNINNLHTIYKLLYRIYTIFLWVNNINVDFAFKFSRQFWKVFVIINQGYNWYPLCFMEI